MRTRHNTAPARRWWLFLAVPAVAALALTLALAIPARAFSLDNIHIPFSGQVVNACNGELVTYSGDEHLVADEVIDDSGGFHLDLHENLDVTGTGDQGNSYVAHLTTALLVHARFGEEQTLPNTSVIVSQGAAPNFTVHSTLHLTVNANGTITAFVDDVSSTCQG